MQKLYIVVASLVFAFGSGVLVALEAVEAHAELRVRAARRLAADCQPQAAAPVADTPAGSRS